MKPIHFAAFLPLLFLVSPGANAAASMLRIACDGDNAGAEVLVNGKFRGECPIDLQVPEGSLKVLVRKKVDAQRERAFEQEIRMGEGSVKKVEAQLGRARLNTDEESRRAANWKRLEKMPFDTVQKEAMAGNAEAMLRLWYFFRNGENGTPKNEALADKWLRKAAEAGNAQAMEYVSIFSEDKAESNAWLHKAAEAGNVSAMDGLANNYKYGTPVLPKSDDKSSLWYREALIGYRRAAEQGDSQSMFKVGSFYRSGFGVPQSNEEAVTWWRKSADTGFQAAMFFLGRCYAEGQGVAKSEEQAIYWWRKAAEGNYPEPNAVEALKKRGLR